MRRRIVIVLEELKEQGIAFEEIDSCSFDSAKIVFVDKSTEVSQEKGTLELLISFEDQVNYTVGVLKSKRYADMIKIAGEEANNCVDDAIKNIVTFWKAVS